MLSRDAADPFQFKHHCFFSIIWESDKTEEDNMARVFNWKMRSENRFTVLEPPGNSRLEATCEAWMGLLSQICTIQVWIVFSFLDSVTFPGGRCASFYSSMFYFAIFEIVVFAVERTLRYQRCWVIHYIHTFDTLGAKMIHHGQSEFKIWT